MVCSHGAMLWSRFLANQRLVDMRDDTTASNRRLDQAVQFLISSDGELKMSRRNSFYFEILGRVSRQLENFGSQILKNCSAVDGRSSSNSSVRRRPRFEMSVDSSNGELETGLG